MIETVIVIVMVMMLTRTERRGAGGGGEEEGGRWSAALRIQNEDPTHRRVGKNDEANVRGVREGATARLFFPTLLCVGSSF